MVSWEYKYDDDIFEIADIKVKPINLKQKRHPGIQRRGGVRTPLNIIKFIKFPMISFGPPLSETQLSIEHPLEKILL